MGKRKPGKRKPGSITEYGSISVVSGEPAECVHHLIPGSGKRALADEDGLTVPLTHEEHNLAEKPEDRVHGNHMAEAFSRIAGQLAYEKKYYKEIAAGSAGLPGEEDPAREAFRDRYGMSYL